MQPANLSASNLNWRAQEMEPGLKRQSLLIIGAGGGIGEATAFGNEGGDLAQVDLDRRRWAKNK